MTVHLPQLGLHVSFLVDTGSSVTLLPWTQTQIRQCELQPYKGRVLSVCGEALQIMGQCCLDISVSDKILEQDFLIVRGLDIPILGVDFLRKHSAVIDVANQVISFAWGTVALETRSLLGTVSLQEAGNTKSMEGLERTLQEFHDVIRADDDLIGETDLIEHEIVLEEETPVNARPRPIPFHLREVVHEQISKMLRLGVIRKSTSPWSSPILLVPKSDGKYRFCVDFRRLNAKSRKDVAPVPRIDTVFAMIGNSEIFSTMDLLSGFWQVPMAKQACKYTAFTVANQHFEFVKCLLGCQEDHLLSFA